MLSSSTRPAEPCDHEIAPNGDVVLVLKNANAPFAIWGDPAAPASTSASAETKSPPPASSIKFLVSSHHLKSASPVFRAALTGPWNESILTKDGHHQITAEDWDVRALLAILYAVHGRNNYVPKIVTLELLCKIAVLVDYYRVHEAVRFPCLLWVDDLRGSVPRTYGRELVLWLCVSWVFQNEDILQAVAATAIGESTEPISALELPISGVVINEINMRRELAFASLTVFLEDLQTDFIDGTKGCSFSCQSTWLGVLMKNMVARGILDRVKNWYFQGMSVAKAVRAVEEIHQLPKSPWPMMSDSRCEECRSSLDDAARTFAESVMIDAKQPLDLKAIKDGGSKDK